MIKYYFCNINIDYRNIFIFNKIKINVIYCGVYYTLITYYLWGFLPDGLKIFHRRRHLYQIDDIHVSKIRPTRIKILCKMMLRYA